jgi:ADP-dependent NAD(P)H-hydrate dehydratase / NAD(P)H-hydrate epimerase
MKLLSAAQIRELDLATMRNEPISSIDLMERAATKCTEWILENSQNREFIVISGTGNNGGDGLAIARLLTKSGCRCRVVIAGTPKLGSPDFRTNFERLKLSKGLDLTLLDGMAILPEINEEEVVIDALFGTGLNRPAEGWLADLIEKINRLPNHIISIDIPSGMGADYDSVINGPCVHADYTLTFHIPKTSFLFAESGIRTGLVVTLDIGLDRKAHGMMSGEFELADARMINLMMPRVRTFDHKGRNGNALIVAGSAEMPGAGVLASMGALYGGAGIVRIHGTESDMLPPEVIRSESHFTETQLNEDRAVAIIGPGLGENATKAADKLLKICPLLSVWDADALNAIAREKLLEQLPKGAVLTPHPKEFDRLFGLHENARERMKTLREKSRSLGVTIVLKGAYTRVATPDGRLIINPTGNPGMAKGGTGDVLTGLIGALMARGLKPENAAIVGVYLHGMAGDFAARTFGFEGLTASRLAAEIPAAFKAIRQL